MVAANNNRLEHLGHNARKALTQFVFIVYGVVVVFPMVWLGYTAFKPTDELFASAWALPSAWKLDNFIEAWNEAQIGDFFWNSIFVTISTLLLQLFLGAMASYSLAKYRFPGKNLLYYGFLAGLMFPIFLGLVPLFFLVKSMGLLDTHLGLILVYAAFGLPFTVFVLTAFFRTIPTTIMEAGIIDGCGHFNLFLRVMLPLAKPGLTTVGIFTFISIWERIHPRVGLAFVFPFAHPAPRDRRAPIRPVLRSRLRRPLRRPGHRHAADFNLLCHLTGTDHQRHYSRGREGVIIGPGRRLSQSSTEGH